MKFISRACSATLFILVAAVLTSTARAEGNEGGSGRLAFLATADRVHLLKVRQKVLNSDANLKAEQESLRKEREFVKDKGANATREDRQTLAQNVVAHGQNMRSAMVKADPSVAPLIDQVTEKMKERHRQQQGVEAASSPNS